MRRVFTSRHECGRNGNLGAAIAHCRIASPDRRRCTGEASGSRRFALAGRRVDRHLGGLGQKTGIIGTEHAPAEPDGRVDLGLAEWPVGIVGVAQGVEQDLGAGFEIKRQFRIGARVVTSLTASSLA